MLAYATSGDAGGAGDQAQLYDSSGNDIFAARPTFSYLAGTGFNNFVQSFDRVTAYATAGDAGGLRDQAFLYDSTGNDILAARSTTTYLTGSGFYNSAYSFDRVLAYAGEPTGDVGYFYDSAGDETFFGRDNFGQMTGTGFAIYAQEFKRLIANAPNAGTNILDVQSLDYLFAAFGRWQKVILQDDFNGSALSTTNFRLPDAGDAAYLGRTQIRTDELPAVTGGNARLRLDTYNRASGTPGEVVLGSEIISRQSFERGNGLVMEARMRLVDDAGNPLIGGMVGGFFLYVTNGNVRDEIDFELLSNDAVANTQRVLTNAFDDDSFNQAGDFQYVNYAGSPLTGYNTFRIEWLPDRIRWFVNGQMVREETETLPDEEMNLRLNLWAANVNFTQAYNSALQPTDVAASNRTFFMDVDYVTVREFI